MSELTQDERTVLQAVQSGGESIGITSLFSKLRFRSRELDNLLDALKSRDLVENREPIVATIEGTSRPLTLQANDG